MRLAAMACTPLVRVDDQAVAQAHGDGVAGEVAPAEVLLERDLRPRLDVEVLVAVGLAVLLAVAARHGDVEGAAVAGELEHREALADGIGFAEFFQLGRDLLVAHAGDQQVDVLVRGGLFVEDAVAYRAAHDVNGAAENGDEKILLREVNAQPLHDGQF